MAGGRTLAILGTLVAALVGAGVWLALSEDGTGSGGDGAPPAAEEAPDAGKAETGAAAAKPARRAARTVGTAALTGVVKRRGDKSPAAGQVVELLREGAEPWSVEADAAGAFRLDSLPDGGPYELRVVAKGFATVRLPGIGLARGEARDVGTLWLDRAIRLPVQVRDYADRPVAGANVEAFAAPEYGDDFDWSRAYAQMAQEPVAVARATSDARGTAVFPELATGNWSFSASAPGRSRGGASHVTLRSDEEVPEVVIRLGAGHVLAGRVLDSERKPVAKAVVMGGSMGSAWDLGSAATRSRATSDAEGRFQLEGVHGGFVALWAGRQGTVPAWRATVRVPGVTQYDIELRATGSIEGTVTQKETGLPVEGAEVVATRWSMSYDVATATTDAKGRYRIEQFPVGQVNELQAKKDGLSFLPPDDSTRSGEAGKRVSAGETLTADLVMAKGASVAGTVTSRGAPVAGAKVVVRGGRPGQGIEWTRSATTDAAGAWRVESAAPGRAFAMASREGYWQKGATGNWWQVLEDESRATELKVTVPETGEAKLDLFLEKGAAVAGRVEGPDGPVGGAKVWAGGVNTVSKADGTFALEGVQPGAAVEFSAWKRGLVAAEETKLSIPEEGPAPEVVLRLGRPAVVTGRVTTADGSPLADARVALVEKSDESERTYYVPWQEAQTDLSGQGAQPLLPDGTFRLELTQREGSFVVHAWDPAHGGADSPKLAVEPGRAEYATEVRFGAGLTLRGRVIAAGAGTGVAGADVAIERHREGQEAVVYWGGDMIHTVYAVTGADGRFEAAALSEGAWNVRVAAPGLIPSTKNAVKLPATAEVQIELSQALEISGTVAFADGTPAAGVQVTAQGAAAASAANVVYFGGMDEDGRNQATTDAKGRFTIRKLAAGNWKLRVATSWGSSVNVRPATAGPFAAGAKDVKLTVQAGGTISGRVVGADGKGVGGAWINANRESSNPGDEDHENSWSNTQTKPDGSFELTGLSEGARTLQVQAEGNHKPAQRKGVAVGTRDLVITLETGLAIEGVVVDAEGAPVGDVYLQAQRVRDAERSEDDIGWGTNCSTDSEGKFRLGGLSAGRYKVTLAPWGNEGKSRVLQGADEVAAGSSGLRLVAIEGLKITGLVVDEAGNPVKGASVQPVLSGSWRQAVITGADGRFTLSGLAAGQKVSFNVSSAAHGRGSLRDVTPGGPEVRIVLAKGLTASGRLLDAEGKPVPRSQLFFSPAPDGGAAPEAAFGGHIQTETDDQGRFTVQGLAAGTWNVSCLVPQGEGSVMLKQIGSVRAGSSGTDLTMLP